MARLDRRSSLLMLGLSLSLGLSTFSLTPDRALAQTVVIDGVSVRTSSGFSFTYTEPRIVPGYPIGGFPFRSGPRSNSGINRSVLVNPTIVNSPIYNSTLINPTIVNSPGYGNSGYSNPGYGNPGYQPYPYTIYTIQTVDRPAPEIVVDPEYGVRFKRP